MIKKILLLVIIFNLNSTYNLFKELKENIDIKEFTKYLDYIKQIDSNDTIKENSENIKEIINIFLN